MYVSTSVSTSIDIPFWKTNAIKKKIVTRV